MNPEESILVVDDDPDFLDIIRRILERKGYLVATASSAGMAIERVKERFYNITILDISLPDADGTELLSRLIEIHPDIIAIMLTGHSSVQNAITSLNRGAFAYLEKPVGPDNLLSVITRGLEKQRLVVENHQLMEELEQRNRITDTLLNVSQAVSRSLDRQQIIDAALERIAHTAGIQASFVYLHDKDKLVLSGYHGFTPEMAWEVSEATGNGVLGRIFTEGEPVIIDDMSNGHAAELVFLRNGGYRSLAGIPLTIVGESIGVMCAASRRESNFSPNSVELLSGIGREIAIAVRNAQLYEEASSARALRELDTMRTDFLANVSHELRTPLAVIKGSANSLLQPDVIFDEATRRDFLQSIDRDADTLTRLVDDLLIMSRLEADALEMKRSPHKLNDVVGLIKDRLDTLTTKHHLNIRIPAKLPPVLFDDVRIGEVLTNLVENAVKYSDDNTGITISAAQSDEGVIVSVTDEGAGIPPELHQKIFERFFQGNGRKAGRRKGTGLGLAICHGIIEAHGGRIWVESEPGRGSTFSFSLPTG